MSHTESPGARFRAALAVENPLQVIGAINANHALLVDIDTGFGPSAFNIARTVKSLIKAGAAACHIEDQVGAKRCGHRPGKEIVSAGEMVDRVKAAADAKTDADFFLIARTDAIAV